MNATMKNLLLLAIGAGIGSLVTYRLLKDKYEALIDEEIESVKETFSRRTIPVYDELDNGLTQEEYEEGLGHLEYKRPARERTAYNHISRPEEADENEILAPYVIHVVEYHESNLHFDKSTIYYYDLDDTLVDENEEPIADVDAIIGDGLMRFGDGSDDPDIVYVRNEKLGIDYEVIRVEKSYQETVLGMTGLPIRKKGKHVIKREESDIE